MPTHNQIKPTSPKPLFVALFCVCALVCTLASSSAFAAAKPTSNSSENSEVKLGKREHEKLLETTHFYQDPILNAYVDEIGQKLAANGDWPEIEYHFFIIDSPDINAFALPGGYIYINRGLLSYLTSEAQLAGVLAHEIAHVTRHHSVRRLNKQRLGNATAFVASLLTLNSNVGEAIQLETSAFVSGYGREMELEADEYGATYLYNTGYDPNAMMEVLGILKNHERFSILKGREAGKAPNTYHGVFSSHPKNDKRLQEVVAQAGQLPPGAGFQGRDVYRQMLDNMVYGENDTTLAPPGFDRYASKSLGVTYIFPENWTRVTEGQKIVMTSDDGMRIELRVAKPQPDNPTAEALLENRHLPGETGDELKKMTPLYDAKERKNEAGYALLKTAHGDKRVGVIKSGSYEYYFDAITPQPLSKKQDNEFIALLESFRRTESHDFPPDDIFHVYFHRLEPGETFADLATGNAIGKYTEEELRLVNGYYPTGEAEPGTWIKMAK